MPGTPRLSVCGRPQEERPNETRLRLLDIFRRREAAAGIPRLTIVLKAAGNRSSRGRLHSDLAVRLLSNSVSPAVRVMSRYLRRNAKHRAAEMQVQHSAQPRLDNCFRDNAVTNARQLTDLLASAEAAVISPSG